MSTDTSKAAAPTTARSIVLTLCNSDELFAGPEPGGDFADGSTAPDWDAVGATLGEPGVNRLLRLLHARRDADEIVIRIREGFPADTHIGRAADQSNAIVRRLRAWMRARVASNMEMVRVGRRIGVRILAVCTVVLGMILALAWFLQQESPLGPPGPLRVLAAEAMVIAGWVVMWRPIELLVFDPMRPTFERRMLERALLMPIRVERANPAEATAGSGE